MRLDPNYTAGLVAAISSSAYDEQRLTSQLASGIRVSTLGDDPVAASSNVQIQRSIAAIDAFTTSASREQGLLQVTDSALGEVVTRVTSALSLAVSATNGTLNDANRAAIARQVSDLRDSVVSLANSSYGGKYLFSGSQGTTKPFSLDSSTTPATTIYAGDDRTQSITTPDGTSIQTNVAGSAVFTAAGNSLLGTLNQLVVDVSSGDSTKLAADTANLTAALGTVSVQRSIVGSSLSRLNSASGYQQTQQTVLKAQQSALLGADPATVATGLKAAEVQHQALLSVVAALNQVNLFSYIK